MVNKMKIKNLNVHTFAYGFFIAKFEYLNYNIVSPFVNFEGHFII